MSRLLLLNLGAAILGAYLANQKGRTVVGWALICFLVPILVVVIAFLPAAASGKRMVRCPNCGAAMEEGAGRCSRCGTARAIDMVECPHCHTVVPVGSTCGQCHKPLP